MPDEYTDGHFPRRDVDNEILQWSTQGHWPGYCSSGFKCQLYCHCLQCGGGFYSEDVKSGNVKASPPSSSWEVPDAAAGPVPQPEAGNAIPTESAVLSELSSSAVPNKRASRGRPPLAVQYGTATDSPFHRAPKTSPLSPSWPRRDGQRGRPPNGSRQGSQLGFKGVRTRKGVRGYLVEIRPPRWKRTIWLGTYSTSAEAAGAYDAGVFYTKKNTRYNFQFLEGSFPPLPSQLRLDRPEDSEEIKTFVQRQAQEAARKVKGFSSTCSTTAKLELVDIKPVVAAEPDNIATSGTSETFEAGGTLHAPPLDFEFFAEWELNSYTESLLDSNFSESMMGDYTLQSFS